MPTRARAQVPDMHRARALALQRATPPQVFTYHGTAAQRRIAAQAIATGDFPYVWLLPRLRSKTGRAAIPIDWADLSRFAAAAAAAETGEGHAHVHEGMESAHPVVRPGEDGRARVLGLAWYSGRITLDLSLEQRPALATEVTLAEAAHMVDFFYMGVGHRHAVTNALHRQQLPAGAPVGDGIPHTLDGHTCGWFDVNTYAWWVGEAFMEAFLEAFSPAQATLTLRHTASREQAAAIRRILLGPTP